MCEWSWWTITSTYCDQLIDYKAKHAFPVLIETPVADQ